MHYAQARNTFLCSAKLCVTRHLLTAVALHCSAGLVSPQEDI